MTLELLTHTKRRDFQNCRRYYFHRHVQHIQSRWPKGGRRRGAAFGDAVFAVEAALRDAAYLSPEAIRGVARVAVDDHYRPVLEAATSQDEVDDLLVEATKVTLLAPAYADRYGLRFGRRERRELQFDLPLINPATGKSSRAFRRGGKIDGMVVVGHRRAVVVEDKLVGSIQQAMIERLPLDHQVSEYVDALLSRGWDAEVYYRHTRLPGSNPVLVGKKEHRRRETLEEYEERLAGDIADRPAHYFDEQRLLFTHDHLEDYRRGRWGISQQIIEARRQYRRRRRRQLGFWEHTSDPRDQEARDYAFPMNPSRCWEYGGCEFIPLCTKRPGAEDLYVEVPDNPELRREEEDGATAEYHGA